MNDQWPVDRADASDPAEPAALTADDRRAHERWALELSSLPTAAGREGRVVRWIERWVAARPELRIVRDDAGNMIVEHAEAPDPSEQRPLLIASHLDHPAFVVEGMLGESAARLSFRGGVLDAYFQSAPIDIVLGGEGLDESETVRATVVEAGKPDPYRACVCEFASPADAVRVSVGDIGRWAMPGPAIEEGELRTHACDDLAALAASLAALDALRARDDARHARLLLTRAEEVGFIGAIHACRGGFLPRGSRVLMLENSRSFPESPVGGGPVVRVGDRLSIFDPAFTGALVKLCERIDERRRPENAKPGEGFRFQRKLMPGGACEATVYHAWGFEASCVCLPLGNYHNMADLERVQAGDEEAVAKARCDREFIAVADYHGLVDLLIESALGLGTVKPMRDRLDTMYDERKAVLTGG